MIANKNLLKDAAVSQRRHWVRVTRACNNKCLFCLDHENQNGSILSMKEIIIDLRNGFSLGAKRVIISGGDPTVHPRLNEIIKKAKRIGYEHVQIITNGRMLAYGNFAADLKKAGLDEVTLSLHSHIKEDFEKMTGVVGSYEQALYGLLNAKKQGFIVSVDIVINKINYKKLKETLQFYIKLGVSEFDLLYPIPFGDAWKNQAKLFFSPEKSQKYLSDAFSLSKNKNLFIWTNRFPAQYLEGFEDLIQNPIKLHDEVYGMRSELMNLFKYGLRMSCQGDRCQYCFMKNYCIDFKELLEKKKISTRKKQLCGKTESVKEKENKVFKLDSKFTLEAFTDFYINNRYFVKSLRCQSCKQTEACEGSWIEDVRKNGFSTLKPKIK